jgi:rubrerythrin
MSSPDIRGRGRLPDLAGTATHEQLKRAFALEAQQAALLRYVARLAELEGQTEVARRMSELALSQDLYAAGHIDLLLRAGDPLTDLPLGSAEQSLRALAAQDIDQVDLYAEAARTAHAEGFPDIASWLETMELSKRGRQPPS